MPGGGNWPWSPRTCFRTRTRRLPKQSQRPCWQSITKRIHETSLCLWWYSETLRTESRISQGPSHNGDWLCSFYSQRLSFPLTYCCITGKKCCKTDKSAFGGRGRNKGDWLTDPPSSVLESVLAQVMSFCVQGQENNASRVTGLPKLSHVY